MHISRSHFGSTESSSIWRPDYRNLFHPPSRDIASKKMAQIYVGDMVTVEGLMSQTHYNGRLGVVTALISSNAENKCEIKLVRDGAFEEKQLIIKTTCLHLVAAGHRDHPEPEPECSEDSQCSPSPSSPSPSPSALVGYGQSHEPRQSIKPMVWGLAARKRET